MKSDNPETKTDKEYWGIVYSNIGPEVAAAGDIIRLWIKQHFPPVPSFEQKTCFEIGCYPGRYLSVFGELGYELYGIDYCAQLDKLPVFLKEQGYNIGQFWTEDFINFEPGKRFDVVVSFGFLEHFVNFEEVLLKQMSLVDRNGYLVVEVPNFIGYFQRCFHYLFNRESYRLHHIPAMEIERWIKILKSQNFEVVYKGYFGKFLYWVENQQRSLLTRIFLRGLSKYIQPKLAGILPSDKKLYSPFGGVIAQKK